MEITIYTAKKKLDADYLSAISEYAKRTSPYCQIKLKTNQRFDKKIPKLCSHTMYYIITAGTETISSIDLSKLISTLNVNGYSAIVFFICENELEKAYISDSFEACSLSDKLATLCLSSFTLEPDIAITALTEQLYRAYTILNNITYHK